MEFILDFLCEFFVELYIEIATLIVPEHKYNKWIEVLLKIFCILISIATISLIVVGILFLLEGEFINGLLFLLPGIFILLIHVAMVVIINKRTR